MNTNSNYHSLLRSKYKSIIKRSFESKLDIFLFQVIINKKKIDFDKDEFIKFNNSNDELIKEYELVFQLNYDEIHRGMTINEIDQEYDDYFKRERNKEIKILFEEYCKYFEKKFPINSFEKIYEMDDKKRLCYYCQTSEYDLSRLRAHGAIRTKRNRGWSMELDRKNPNKEYLEDNVVLACYWCNNAKTDEFSESEFKDVIGPAIGKIWQKRLSDLK